MRLATSLLAVLAIAACGQNDDEINFEPPAPREGTPNADIGTEIPAPENPVAAAGIPTDGLSSFFDCIDREDRTLIAAHRAGPAPGFPENALATMKNTLATTGAFVMEVDVATSSDGVLFLHHDDQLDRTTTGRGTAAQQSWSDLRTLSLKDPNGQTTAYPITTLEEALEWARGNAILELDMKPSTDYDDVAALLARTEMEAGVVVIGYTRGQAVALANRFPEAMLSVPVESEDDLTYYADRGINPARILAWTGTRTPNPDLYSLLDDRTVEVLFGTLGGRQSIDNQIEESGSNDRYAELAEMGVDLIATDRPGPAQRALAGVGRAVGGDVCRTDRELVFD